MKRPEIYGQNVVPVNQSGEFTAKRKEGLRIPYGYIKSKDDPDLLLPDEPILEALLQAFDYIDKSCSYRDTCRWLADFTGKHISHVGLYQKYKQFKKELRKAKTNARKQEREATAA